MTFSAPSRWKPFNTNAPKVRQPHRTTRAEHERRLLALFGSIYGEESPQLAWQILERAKKRIHHGHLDEALRMVRKAGAMLRWSVGPENYLYGHALCTYAELLTESGDSDHADAVREQGMSTLSNWGF